MKEIDRQFLEHPYYGVERMTDYLNLDLGYRVNVKRIRRLYKIMVLQTIYAKPKTTIRDKTSYVYPYLLKNLKIDHPNQVWQTDIIYIPMFRGFIYMAAIIDVHSRKILNWSVSNSMSAEWCTELLNDTIQQYGAPQIHNSDQGSQYTLIRLQATGSPEDFAFRLGISKTKLYRAIGVMKKLNAPIEYDNSRESFVYSEVVAFFWFLWKG